MRPGDRISWMQPLPQSGRWFAYSAAGVVRKMGSKNVQIEVRMREHYGQRSWLPALKWVPKETVTPRVVPSEVLSEPMQLYFEGFEIKAWKHPAGGAKLFPDGIWYGDIDDYQVGAPCASEEDAVRMAYQMLLNGQYRTALQSAIEASERRLTPSSSEKYCAEAVSALPDLRERLAKVEKIRNTSPSEPIAVHLLRGNPNRGAETGPGYGRLVPALFLREFDQAGFNVKCRLLADDPDAVGKPNVAGEEEWWSVSQLVWGAVK